MTSQPQADHKEPEEAPKRTKPAESAFPKATWIGVAGRGAWRKVKSPVMAAALARFKPGQKITNTEVLAAIKAFQKGE